jgi:hypothetical protein
MARKEDSRAHHSGSEPAEWYEAGRFVIERRFVARIVGTPEEADLAPGRFAMPAISVHTRSVEHRSCSKRPTPTTSQRIYG